MKKIIIALSLVGLHFSKVAAQLPYQYTFSQFTAPYVPLGNTSTVISGNTPWSDMDEFPVPHGFTFPVFGYASDTTYVSPGSGMFFGNTSAASLWIYSGDALSDPTGLNTSVSKIRYEVSGSTGNRIVKIQLDSAGFKNEYWSTNSFSSYVKFQVWLHEADSSIEIHFGPSSIVNPQSCFYAGGPVFSMLHFINQGSDYGLTLSGNPASATATVSYNPPLNSLATLTGAPASGVVYRFSPLMITGINDITANETSIRLYPNPTNGLVSVDAEGATGGGSKFIVRNTLGEIVMQCPATMPHQSIDVSSLAAGIYFIQKDNGQMLRFVRY